MAKISTYPTDSSVSGGDMLIGTDVDNANATKNFTVSSLISYAATNNLVPYTGATQDVNLGSNDLLVGGTLGVTGLSSFGDISVSGSTNLNDLTVNNGISLTGELFTNGSSGTAGYILTSQGASLSPSWVNGKLTFVPYTGATANVDLGAYTLTSASGIVLSGTNAPLTLNGSTGTAGQILISGGAGLSPSWVNIATAVDGKLWKGSFYDSVTQTLTGGANVAVPMILNTTDTAATNGISVVTDGSNLTRITVANTAVYNLMFSAQFANSGGTSQTVDIWLRKNGSTAAANIADTNGKVYLQGNASHVMAAWNYFVPLNAGDYIQLMWTATSTNVTMVYEAANAVHPANPSIIVTLNQV